MKPDPIVASIGLVLLVLLVCTALFLSTGQSRRPLAPGHRWISRSIFILTGILLVVYGDIPGLAFVSVATLVWIAWDRRRR
jgi:hypothetical protein